MICRNCHSETGNEVLVDLGAQPLSNNFVSDPGGYEPRYPLAPVVCQNWHCRLIQLPAVPESPFTAAYPYRSGQSHTWIKHLEELAASVNHKVGQYVVEVGGNDGSLGDIVRRQGRTYVNIDPTADSKKIGTIPSFLTRELGEHFGPRADWVVANNVMAHVPDLDDFLGGIAAIMRPGALLTVEVPDAAADDRTWRVGHDLPRDYSYFDRSTAIDALERRGFFVSHTEPLSTHGGSIRLYARRAVTFDHPLSKPPLRIMKPYPAWTEPNALNEQALRCGEWNEAGKRVVGYGAPAKANTWLNLFPNTGSWLEFPKVKLDYIVDSTPEKIGKFTPASHIPIYSPLHFEYDLAWNGAASGQDQKIDIVVILAWNYALEILPKVPEGPEVWARGERLR